MTNRVLVLSSTKKPLMPCHPARARELLDKGKAAVFRRYPFTIILKHRADGGVDPTVVKIDPGSKTTGIALTVKGKRGERYVMGIHLEHRGYLIKKNLASRAASRRNRRNRKTRYRKPRFLNRTRPAGWLPPSLMHRVMTTLTWVKRLCLASPVSKIEIEHVSFDTQKMLNDQIKGKEYQQGTLQGYKIREYLLYRYNHTCQYCSGISKDKRLETEHVTPKAQGGSDSITNLTLSCHTCNRDKGNRTPAQWEQSLKGKGDALSAARRKGCRRVTQGKKPPLRDAAAVNSTAKRLIQEVREIGLLTVERPAYMTKYNRHRQGYPKDHFIDAAVLGGGCDTVYIPKGMRPLTVKAMGRNSRQMCRVDRYGFPRTSAKGPSLVYGYRTGDIVRAEISRGRYAGTYTSRVVVRSSGYFDIHPGTGERKITINHRCLRRIQCSDGYQYNF